MAAPEGDRQEFDWDLPVNVPTIGVHRTLRVTSNESIGAVMIKLASKLGKWGAGGYYEGNLVASLWC